jgi:3-oxoacyl-[acyl-carrier protein] reductase
MGGISRAILVTGATGGIGSAVCKRLPKAGNSLVLAARDAGKLQILCSELSNTCPITCSWISVDMTLDDSVKKFAEELTARNMILDGAVLMPPQDPPANDPLSGARFFRTVLWARCRCSRWPPRP